MGAAPSPTALADRARQHARAARASLRRFTRPAAFRAPPPDADAAALRVARNLRAFRLHYAVLLWIALLLALFPARRPTALFLMAMSKVLASYLLLLRSFPSSWLLHRALDKRVVLALLLLLVLAELLLTDSLGHLFMAVGVGGSAVLLHAAFRAVDDGDAAVEDSVEEKEKKEAEEV